MNCSILERTLRDGSKSYRAQVRVFKGRKLLHSESKSFERRSAAEEWMHLRQKALENPEHLKSVLGEDPTLAEAIDQYLASLRISAGKTKRQVLHTIKGLDLGKRRCSSIMSRDLVAFANQLGQSMQPQTVGNYMAHLSTVFSLAKPAFGYPLDYQQMQDARKVLKHQGTISRSNQRDRRPTLDELDRLLTHFAERERRDARVTPMTLITLFGIFSTRRQEEISRVAVADLDQAHHELMVRDMKHPGEKIGNDVRTTLTPQALAIIQLQLAKPRVQSSGRIFPYSADAISRAFTDACAILGIEDLHFHDLRHDGISRLFEMGWSIPNVAMVSAHRTWTSLKRYTHIRQSGDKYLGWSWLQKLGISHKA